MEETVLIHNPKGNYHFLKGIDPYSCGVIADSGYEIVNVTLKNLVPWREGFTHIDAYLKAQGRWTDGVVCDAAP